jgi:glycosyltransferase involved in cell wall biosynthesis
MAGRFDPAKGHLIFLQAAAEIRKKRSDVTFVVAGGMMMGDVIPSLKDYHVRVKEYCHDAGMDADVIFLGHRNDMPDVLRSLDVYVCPSISEGFGLTVVEALACGVPVVTSATVGVLDLIAKESNVFIAETGNAASFAASIGQALTAKRKEIGISDVTAMSSFKHIGWAQYARRFEQVYAELSEND